MQTKNLWAPWRMDYIQQLGESGEDAGCHRCFLCDAGQCEPESDEARRRLVLLRDHRGLLILNRYPYTNGHLMAACLDHVGDLVGLSSEQRGGLFELTALGQRLLEVAINPQGFNMGINIGRCAGAGLPGHVHMHIVPRWGGDTNFIHLFGQVRVIPQALEHSYEHLAETLKRLNEDDSGAESPT